MIYETNRHEKLTDKLRIDFLELPKAKNTKTNAKLQEWLDLLNVTTEEGLEMLEKNTVNPTIIGKAVAVVRQISADEKLLYAIQKREETLMNECSVLNSAKQQGIEQGIKQGLKKKESELISKWRKKGYTEEQIQELLSE